MDGRRRTLSLAHGRRLGVLICVLAFAYSAMAPAGRADVAAAPSVTFALGSAAMQQAERLAVAHWGVPVCGGVVDIKWTTLDSPINATSSWLATDPNAPFADPANNTQCEIDLNIAQSFDWPKFCTVVIHEFGHLTGHEHSPDPNDIMSPYYTQPAPECTDGSSAPDVAVPVSSASTTTTQPVSAPSRRSTMRARKAAAKCRRARRSKKASAAAKRAACRTARQRTA
jgi:hypothetical protein